MIEKSKNMTVKLNKYRKVDKLRRFKLRGSAVARKERWKKTAKAIPRQRRLN